MQPIRTALLRGDFARMTMSSAAIVAFQMAGTGLTFAYTLLMARIMSPADVGVVWTIWSAVYLGSVFANLNIGNAAVREVVHARALGQNDLASGFVVVLRRIILILSLPVTLLFVAAYALFDPATFAQHAPFIVVAAASLPVVAWERANTALAAALDKGVVGRVSVLFVRPLFAFLPIAALALLDERPGVGTILSIFAFTGLVAVAMQAALMAGALRAITATPPRTDRWRDWVLAGVALIPSRTLSDNLKNLFVFASALTLADADVARFAIAFSLIVFLNFGIMAVEVIFDPKVSAAIARDDVARRDTLLGQAGLLKLVPVAIAAVLLVVLARPIMSLFGTAYVETAPVVAWLVLMPLTRAALGPSIMILQVHGRRLELMWAALVGIIACVAGVALGGALGGLEGAAIGGSLAYAATQVATFAICLRRTGVNPSPFGYVASLLRSRGVRPHASPSADA